MLRYVFGIAIVGAAACGGSVAVKESSSGGVGGASSASSGAGPSTSDVGVSVGEGPGPSSGPTTGAGGAPACGETNEMATIQVATWDGMNFGCTLGQPTDLGEITLTGEVLDFDGSGAFTIDSCAPNADCAPMISKVYVAAPELYFYVPVGAYVDLRLRVEQPWGCTNTIQIRNRPEWGGLPNPFESSNRLWLAAGDGSSFAFDDSGFVIQELPLGCYPNDPPNCATHEDYALQFLATQNPSSITVGMGQTVYGWVTGSEQQPDYLAVRNLRSFETGNCDDYWNWAYWVTQAPLEG